MTGSTDLAVRNGHAPAESTGALAIYGEQTAWTSMQEAALNQLGLKNAPNGDRMVFLHQCQRTGLDPFAKQIHMIERGGKWGIQTGIDGFRVMRARAERKAGVRGILSQAVYIDAEGNEYRRWFKPMPPVGCEITYTVRELTSAGIIDTPYTSYLRFTEYAQYKADGKLTQKWSQSPAHMLEKCTEADVYRKAFPQDFSGVDLDDSPSAPDEDAPPAAQRQRITADAIRARSAQTVTATVVTPDVPPAQPPSDPPAAPQAPPPAGAGGSPKPASKGQVGIIRKHFERLYPGEETPEERRVRLDETRQLAGRRDPIGSTNELTADEAAIVIRALDKCTDAKALAALLSTGEADGTRDGEGSGDE